MVDKTKLDKSEADVYDNIMLEFKLSGFKYIPTRGADGTFEHQNGNISVKYQLITDALRIGGSALANVLIFAKGDLQKIIDKVYEARRPRGTMKLTKNDKGEVVPQIEEPVTPRLSLRSAYAERYQLPDGWDTPQPDLNMPTDWRQITADSMIRRAERSIQRLRALRNSYHNNDE